MGIFILIFILRCFYCATIYISGSGSSDSDCGNSTKPCLNFALGYSKKGTSSPYVFILNNVYNLYVELHLFLLLEVMKLLVIITIQK
jgi:hypothetical protein